MTTEIQTIKTLIIESNEFSSIDSSIQQQVTSGEYDEIFQEHLKYAVPNEIASMFFEVSGLL